MIRETATEDVTSCPPAAQAFFRSPCPKYWAETMAPPAPMAEKSWMSRMFRESTRETADTAFSPAVVTMTVSAMPTMTARNCSAISGRIRATSAFLVKVTVLLSDMDALPGVLIPFYPARPERARCLAAISREIPDFVKRDTKKTARN